MAYISTEQVKNARKIVNLIGEKYGFKLSTTKEGNVGININLMEGRKITLDDLIIKGYMRNFINDHGVCNFPFDELDSFGQWFELYISGADIHHEWSKYSRISELISHAADSSLHLFKESSDIKIMANEIEKEIKKELKYHNDNDSMIDYYYEAFYFEFKVGKWNKPYKVI